METCVYHDECDRHGPAAPCDPAVCSLYATQDTLFDPEFNEKEESCGSDERSPLSTSRDASTERGSAGSNAGKQSESGGMERAASPASASRMGGDARRPCRFLVPDPRGRGSLCNHGHRRLDCGVCDDWLDVPDAPDVPKADPESPRHDCRGSLDYMVLGMAKLTDGQTVVPVVAVVCGSACSGECSPPCAFGMYSVGIKRAHEVAELNKPRVIALPRGTRLA